MTLEKDNNNLLINILSKKVLLPGESRKELENIRKEVEKDIKPEGFIEKMFCSKIISDFWKMKRLYTFETKILKEQQQESNPENKMDAWNRQIIKRKRFRSTIKQIKYTDELKEIQKHITIISNDLLKTISELNEIQKSRIIK